MVKFISHKEKARDKLDDPSATYSNGKRCQSLTYGQ